MSNYRNARAKKGRALLSVESMERIMRRVLPRRNQEAPINYEELLGEARDFGILTRAQFRALLLRHRRALIAADRGPLTAQDERICRADWGDTVVSERLRRQFWFSWEAMTRIALELEFLDKYERYSQGVYPAPNVSDSETA